MKVSNMKTGYFLVDSKSKNVLRFIVLAAAVLAVGTLGCGPSASAQSDSDSTMSVSEDRSAGDFNFNHAWLAIPPPPDGSDITPPPGEASFEDQSDVARSGYTDPRWERVDDRYASENDAGVLQLPQVLDRHDLATKRGVPSYGYVDTGNGAAFPEANPSDLSGVGNEYGNP